MNNFDPQNATDAATQNGGFPIAIAPSGVSVPPSPQGGRGLAAPEGGEISFVLLAFAPPPRAARSSPQFRKPRGPALRPPSEDP